ncbi:MAG: HDOD domain-containing protein [Tepidisphaeraceae bacterium]
MSTVSDLKEKRIELILQQLQQLPTLPSVAVKVLELTGRDESSAREVINLIKGDPSLTTKVLKLARRADLGVRGEVVTVDRAVVLLGFEAVRSAVLALSAYAIFPPDPSAPPGRFDRTEFWKHSIAVACAAELLAESVSGIDPAEAFVCGLLHDIGKIALDTILPRSYERVIEAADLLRGNVADVERTVIGLDHMVVGKRLAERWQLPASVRDSIWLHGQNPESLPAGVLSGRMVNLITLADNLVREQHIGHSANYTFHVVRPALQQATGVSDAAIEAARGSLIKRIEERADALGLGHATTGEIYLSALSQANQELGRIGEQLAARNRKLASRARYFEALSRFQGELRPDAPSSLVLQAVGQTAQSVIGMAPLIVFSTRPAQGYAEFLMVRASGEVAETSVVDCPARLARPMAGEGPVLPAGDHLEWLMSRVSPLLCGEERFWIALEAEGICVGGIVWGAAAGEAQRLGPHAPELAALAAGWSLALRTSQFREEAHTLAEQLAEANRRLQGAQAELVRTRSVAAVGELAAGAAHEMNNPLAVISGRAQLLADSLEEPKLKQSAQLIFDQSHRLSQIITDLMEFAKPAPPVPAQVVVADLIDRAVREARSRDSGYKRKIELTMDEVPPVLADQEQTRMALVEVLHNALQATDEVGGKIVICAAYDVFSTRVALSVTDNGCGMDGEVLRRAFDPFFSGLPAGRRRGMGLAKALRWIEAGGGTIRLESKPEEGTRAIIVLPAAPRADVGEPARARKAAQS